MSKSSGRQLKIGALLSYSAIGINILSGLIYSPWMLSKIGSGDYGLYTLASSLIHMFLLDFGISSAVSRFTSKYLAEGRQDKVDALLAMVYKLFGCISAILAVLFVGIYFFIDQIYLSLTPDELERFKTVYIIAASFNVISFPFSATLNGIMTSYERFIEMKLCDVANKVITVGLIVSALLMGYGLYVLTAINAMVNLFIYAIKIYLILKKTAIRLNFGFWDSNLLKEIFSFSIWVLLNSVCSRLIMNICPSILGITSGTLAITMFGFASTIEGYTYTFSNAIDGMFIPKISRYIYKDDDRNGALKLMVKVGRYQFGLVGLIVIVFACIGQDFIALWIGEKYILTYYCALLLLLPAPFYVAQQIGKSTLIVTDNVKYLTYVNVGKAALNVVLVFIFSKVFGAVGACAAICTVYFMRNEAYLYLYKRFLAFDIKQFRRDCYHSLFVPMCVAFAIGLVISRMIPGSGWVIFIVKTVLISLTYLVIMWFMGISEEEKRTVRSFVHK